MSAMLTFSFPWNIDATIAVKTVADHFGVMVAINGGAPEVPAHLKAAVEGAYDPSTGTETSPAIAFGALLNGAAGNGQQASQPSAPLAATAALAGNVQTASTHTTTTSGNTLPVEFDSTGLAWDERIHSGNKTKTEKGEWRGKKGADKSMIKAVELELRAKYPGNAATAAASVAGNAAQSNTNGTVSVDLNAKKAAALAYANTEALRVAGPQMIDDNTLAGLLNNKPATLSPEQAEWYGVYYAKRNAAYVEYMARPDTTPPATPGNVTSQPAASATAADVQPSIVVADLDATGLPHDARIHVPAKLKDNAGVWLQRFDVPGEVKLQVMAELRAALAGNAAEVQSTDPAGAAGTSSAAPTPPAAPIAIVTADEAQADFTKLMQWIVANQMAGRITATAGPDAAKAVGFADTQGNGQLVLMREHSAAFPYVVQLLQAQGAI